MPALPGRRRPNDDGASRCPGPTRFVSVKKNHRILVGARSRASRRRDGRSRAQPKRSSCQTGAGIAISPSCSRSPRMMPAAGFGRSGSETVLVSSKYCTTHNRTCSSRHPGMVGVPRLRGGDLCTLVDRGSGSPHGTSASASLDRTLDHRALRRDDRDCRGCCSRPRHDPSAGPVNRPIAQRRLPEHGLRRHRQGSRCRR